MSLMDVTVAVGRHESVVDEDMSAAIATHMAREYLFRHGWRTIVRRGRVFLPLDDDLAAVGLPMDWTTAVLAELRAMDLRCPVVALDLPAATRGVFLVPRGDRASVPWLPGWLVSCWPDDAAVPLPVGTPEAGDVGWLCPPESDSGSSLSLHDLIGVLNRVHDAVHAAGPGGRTRFGHPFAAPRLTECTA